MNKYAKLGLLLPAVLNPATAAVVGIAAIAVGIYRMLPDDDEEATVEAVATTHVPERTIPPDETPLAAVEWAEVERVPKQSNDARKTAPEALEKAIMPTPDADQREVIRKAMSELGKRSAAARARKTAVPDQVP